jgi:uncharacterized Tic20 family protein
MSESTNPQLAQYIQTQQAAGITNDAIHKSLVESGWNVTDVDAAFGVGTQTPTPSSTQSAPAPQVSVPTETQVPPAQNQYGQAVPAMVQDGVTEHKALAIVGYVIPLFFFIPLINDASKHNPFARFHAGQQLNMVLSFVVWLVISRVLSIMLFSSLGYGTAFGLAIVFGLYSLFGLVVIVGFVSLIIFGIINVVNGQMKQLPIIGKFSILK